MKLFTLTIFVFFMSFNLMAQQGTWTTPIPITDDESINRNGRIQFLNFYDGLDYYIFWEKSFDQQSSNIYCRKFDLTDEEQAILESNDHHYRNIQFVPMENCAGNISFLMFYETNMNGNWDIYYKEYGLNGFSEAIEFAVTEFDDQHLRINVAYSYNNPQNLLVWESNNSIKSTKLITNTNLYSFNPVQIVDEEHCMKPTITASNIDLDNNYIVYLKETETDYFDIYFAKYNNDSESFETPVFLTQELCSDAINFDLSLGENYDLIIWNHYDGIGHKTAYCNLSDGEIHMGESTTSVNTSPTSNSSYITMKTELNTSIIVINKEVNGKSQVYGHQHNWTDFDIGNQDLNISNNEVDNINPKIFFGPIPSNSSATIGLGLLYEANFNNQWQIWLSRMWYYIGGNIDKNSTNFELTINQNPILSNELMIDLSLKQDEILSFRIYTNSGHLIQELETNHYNPGEHKLVFSLNNLSSGNYILLTEGKSGQRANQFIKL